jgi:PAS domain S-box-containing protein
MDYRDKTKPQLIKGFKALSKRIVQLKEFEATQLRSDEIVGLMINALDTSLSCIIITNDKGLIFYANPAFFEMFEYEDEAQVTGKNTAELFDINACSPTSKFFVGEDQKNKEVTEFMAQTRNGLQLPVEVAESNVIDDKGKIVARKLSIVNITERKLLEEERISRQLDKEREKATKLKSLRRFAGGVAHDFNNMVL